jgi:hypothetical protein
MDYLDFWDEHCERKRFVDDFLEGKNYASEVDMDSEVLPRLFYPDDYKTNISGANVVLLDHNKHPPEGFWYTTETLWKFKISLCETAPIAIFSSHFGSNMPLKPDIANFYEKLTEAEDFKHLRYEISVEGA